MESTDNFRSAAFSMPPKSRTPPSLHSEKDFEQGGLFQVSRWEGHTLQLYSKGLIHRSPSVTALILFQRVVFPVEASFNRLLWNRSISPNSLLETSISEEVRPRDLEEEEATQTLGPLLPPTTTSRRHTLAEVSTRFHQCSPPC